MTKIIFLRHADTEKDPMVNATLWGLSQKGIEQAKEIVDNSVMDTVESIYVSEEKKTALTAEPIAQKLSKKMVVLPFFNEIKRGDKFLTKEEFEAEKVKQLVDLSFQAFGGESGQEALSRFKRGVAEVIQKEASKTILIVTHGTILNFYFADLLNKNEELPTRWAKTAFCAYGVIENEVVIKDIV
jgi:probable phosphoglycerate mutase